MHASHHILYQVLFAKVPSKNIKTHNSQTKLKCQTKLTQVQENKKVLQRDVIQQQQKKKKTQHIKINKKTKLAKKKIKNTTKQNKTKQHISKQQKWQ